MANINNADIDRINVQDRVSDPTETPASGYAFIYVKNDGLYIKLDSTTVVGPFGTGSSIAFDDLSDTDMSAVTTGSLITYDGANYIAVLTSPGKGSIAVHNGTTWDDLPAEVDGSFLATDSSESTGLKWVNPTEASEDSLLLALIGW